MNTHYINLFALFLLYHYIIIIIITRSYQQRQERKRLIDSAQQILYYSALAFESRRDSNILCLDRRCIGSVLGTERAMRYRVHA